MDQNNRRQELESKLEQSRRLSRDAFDPTTRAMLGKLIEELERSLRQLDQQSSNGLASGAS